MSDRIRLELGEGALSVQPGTSTQASLTVQNTSSIVDQYTIRIDGVDPSWVDISPASVSLFPGDHATVSISFNPPASAESAAGSHPFTIVATSQDNPAESTQLEGSLTIRPFGDLSFSISPEKVTGRQAKYRLALANSGNADIPLTFLARDEAEALKYDFEWERITVPAGGNVEASLDVRPLRGRLTGENEEHRIKVTAAREGQEEQEPLAADVVFEYHPRLGMLPRLPAAKWRWLLLLVPIFAALLALRYCIDRPEAKAKPELTPAATPTQALTPPAGALATPTTPPSPTATPMPLPVIDRFAIERDGPNYVLVWDVTGAEVVTIDGEKVPPSDKKPLGPLASHEFELKAVNPEGGTVSKRVALSVMLPPSINSFVATPEDIKQGNISTLAWEVADAKKATIDGEPLELPKGKKQVKPDQTRDYVLIAENDVGWVVQRVRVNVTVPTPVGP